MESEIVNFFPNKTPRTKQQKALEFVERAVDRQIKHIILAAPTGFGKSFCGTTACMWLGSASRQWMTGQPGGYYLVTQKMLQDQLEKDFQADARVMSIKSASNYPCKNQKYKTCDIGQQRKCNCDVYRSARQAFDVATVSITNYPFFITERLNVGKLSKRRVVIVDECHNLSKVLTRHYDIVVSQEHLDDVEIIGQPPKFDDIHEFLEWCETSYRPLLSEKCDNLFRMIDVSNGENTDRYMDKYNRMSMQLQKLVRCIASAKKDTSRWVFWSQPCKEGLEHIVRPLFAADFADVIFSMGDVIIHMSAYPGEKMAYCESLGLDPNTVAWASFASTFPVENRPIVIGSVGSMSYRNVESTLPSAIRTVSKIMDRHPNEKGLIHTTSYKLGLAIFDGLPQKHKDRILFPKTSAERDPAFNEHSNSPNPTVVLTPSMAEGFDFYDDLARWQVIAKCPYPSLGDKQVEALKDISQDWYEMETAKTLVQMCGRIVRSEKDVGVTYVLDSDVERLVQRSAHMFPQWWLDALVYPQKR